MSNGAPLNIKVNGNSAMCREVARWLSNVSDGVHKAGTQLHQSRSESESSWRGEAGDAFRGHVGRVAKDSDELAQRATNVSKALDAFSVELDSIKQQVAHVRDTAAESGLTTTGDQIMPPGPEPTGAPGPLPHDATDEASNQHDRQQAAFSTALNAHKGKVEAFETASTSMGQLRERETDAHRALATVLSQKTFLDQYGTTLLAKATTTVATGHTLTAGSIEKLKTKIQDFDNRIASVEKGGAGTAAEGLAARTEIAALRTSSAQTAEKLADMQQVGKATKAMGGKVLAANPGSLLENSTSSLGKAARPIAEKIPYAGTIITGAAAVNGIADGKPAAKEVEKAVGDTGASIAAGAAVGTMVGGPVGTVVGVGAGWVASYGVDSLVDWKNGPIEHANRWLGIE